MLSNPLQLRSAGTRLPSIRTVLHTKCTVEAAVSASSGHPGLVSCRRPIASAGAALPALVHATAVLPQVLILRRHCSLDCQQAMYTINKGRQVLSSAANQTHYSTAFTLPAAEHLLLCEFKHLLLCEFKHFSLCRWDMYQVCAQHATTHLNGSLPGCQLCKTRNCRLGPMQACA